MQCWLKWKSSKGSMAKWKDDVVALLLKLARENPTLKSSILREIRRIERNPGIGEYVGETRYYYTDPQGCFRISYNYHPHTKEIEVTVLRLLD